MKKGFLFFCILLPFLAMAQKKNTPAFFANTISELDLKRHLYKIASKEMGGRQTPSPGLEKAADYIEAQMKLIGLTPGNNGSYRQQYPLYKDSMTGSSLSINKKEFKLKEDFVPSIDNNSGTMHFSEAVFAGFGIVDGDHDDYTGLDVKGKLVIIADGLPDGFTATEGAGSISPFGKTINAQKKGAIALLLINGGYPRKMFSTIGNWSLSSDKEDQSIPVFNISENVASGIMGNDAKDILEKIKTKALPSKTYNAEIDFTYFNQPNIMYVANVMGLLEGTDKKNEYVIVSAHYDHLGMSNDTIINYGADDNGSGTVSVLEIAEAFSKAKAAGKGPRRSILFVAVSGEEHGLWGSAYYSNHPVYPLEKTSVDLNIDMIGRVDNLHAGNKDSTNYVYVIGDDKLSSDLAPISNLANRHTKIVLDRRYNDLKDANQYYYRSDHYNFAEKGVPIIFYFNGVHKDYHRPTDTPDKINYPLLVKRAQLVFYTAWDIANRKAMMRRDKKLEIPSF